MSAEVSTDSFPGKSYQGWIGFISLTAEFTPKNVETPELRTRLADNGHAFATEAYAPARLAAADSGSAGRTCSAGRTVGGRAPGTRRRPSGRLQRTWKV